MERTPQTAIPRLTNNSHSSEWENKEMMMKLFQYQWTNSDGSVTLLQIHKKNKQEADLEARQFGWKPKKWWQWWRFNDYDREEPK